jgi:hypothetical protein
MKAPTFADFVERHVQVWDGEKGFVRLLRPHFPLQSCSNCVRTDVSSEKCVKTFATNKHFGLLVIARGAGNRLNGTDLTERREKQPRTPPPPRTPKTIGRLSLASCTIMELTYWQRTNSNLCNQEISHFVYSFSCHYHTHKTAIRAIPGSHKSEWLTSRCL